MFKCLNETKRSTLILLYSAMGFCEKGNIFGIEYTKQRDIEGKEKQKVFCNKI